MSGQKYRFKIVYSNGETEFSTVRHAATKALAERKFHSDVVSIYGHSIFEVVSVIRLGPID